MSGTPTGWQPIETAPRDGRTLLLWDAFREVVVLGCWVLGCWSDEWGGWEQEESYLTIPQPTHWMPLPSPPTEGWTPLVEPLDALLDVETHGGTR